MSILNCKKCAAIFDSREEAISAGYRPCKVCKP
ncbi:MAG: Ada metal-binding domain-containing protein [Thermodesulfobacteriota bacterium]